MAIDNGLYQYDAIARLQDAQLQEKEQKPNTNEGKVQCCAFPLVIMTSNGERDFPPAFLRRCLRIRMPDPDESDLREIVKSHLDDQGIYEKCQELIEKSIRDFMPEWVW